MIVGINSCATYAKTSKCKTLSFRGADGKYYPSGYFSDNQISVARKYLDKIDVAWQEKYKKGLVKKWNKNVSSFVDDSEMDFVQKFILRSGTFGVIRGLEFIDKQQQKIKIKKKHLKKL